MMFQRRAGSMFSEVAFLNRERIMPDMPSVFPR